MLNRVVFTGRLTRDPEMRRTASNTAVASFTIACDSSYRSASGEKNTLFMNCSIFGNKAETVCKYTRKGSLIAVEGRLNQRKYTNRDGINVTVYETIADNVEFLEPKSAAENTEETAYQQDVQHEEGNSGNSLDAIDLMSDDLPF